METSRYEYLESHVGDRGFYKPAPWRTLKRVLSPEDVGSSDVFIDFGGKSQGVAPMQHFETEPKVGDEMEFVVDRYDQREGLLLLMPKGSASANVTWETLEIGQVVEGTVTGMNKGGLELQIKGMRAFMPSGQVNLFYEKDGRDGLSSTGWDFIARILARIACRSSGESSSAAWISSQSAV